MSYDQEPRRSPGEGTIISVKMQSELIVQIEAWALANGISRPEAIRRLVEIGLATPQPKRQPPSKFAVDGRRVSARSGKAKARAADLASDTIDGQFESGVSSTDRASRKQTLLEGPGMVRDIRKD